MEGAGPTLFAERLLGFRSAPIDLRQRHGASSDLRRRSAPQESARSAIRNVILRLLCSLAAECISQRVRLKETMFVALKRTSLRRPAVTPVHAAARHCAATSVRAGIFACVVLAIRVVLSRRAAAVGLTICLVLGVGAVARAQPEQLEITLPDATTVSYPVQQFGSAYYVSVPSAKDLLRAIDPAAEIRWDASTGVFAAKLRGQDFAFYRDQKVLRYGNAIIEARNPLLATRGQVFVPLASLERVLRPLQDVQTNLSQWAPPVSGGPTPDESPGARPAPAGASIETPSQAADLATEKPPDIGARTPAPPAMSRAALAQQARSLVRRRTVVLDPQSPDLPHPASSEGGGGRQISPETAQRLQAAADITLRVAQRCREILTLSSASLQVVITRAPDSPASTEEQRLTQVTGSGAKALVSLRLDSSPFPANSGYRLFVMSSRVDAPGRRGASGGAQQGQGAVVLPLEAAYLPYEELSEGLARLLDSELSRAGLAAAPDKLRQAPFHLLKRVDMPAVCVALGYWSNEKERARMNDIAFVESAARSLAQALLEFDHRLQEAAASEAPAPQAEVTAPRAGTTASEPAALESAIPEAPASAVPTPDAAASEAN